jgi:hypothetical protein
MKQPICPRCQQAELYMSPDGLKCVICARTKTVAACGRCKCIIGDCDGHRAGGTGATLLPCVACSGVASEEVTA